ncbi:hypothetical protein TWF506_009730 [Arthrobotrys conoides]|uniref:Uncharacterized protein n=1 Tax=Arthrobotrys conoides TaxID=74498 RepID=A0AAN8RQH0_9PEZI
MVIAEGRFLSFLLLVGAKYIRPVSCAPVGETVRDGDVVTEIESKFLISQTGIQCSIPFEFRETNPLDDLLHCKHEPSGQYLQTYQVENIPEQILKGLQNLGCCAGTAEECLWEEIDSSVPCNFNYKYACLCFDSAISQNSYKSSELQFQTPSQQISIEHRDYLSDISGGLDPFQQDKRSLETDIFDIDTFCQWYDISMNRKKLEGKPKDSLKITTLSNESTPSVTGESSGPLGSQQRSKIKRDVSIPPLVKSSISAASTKTLPVAEPTMSTGLDAPRNRTLSPPSAIEALNTSSSLEPRVDTGGFIQTEVWVRCATPDIILTHFTPKYYNEKRGLFHYPNWASEVQVSSREDVIALLKRKIEDCGECECKTGEDVRGGFWGLVPNEDNKIWFPAEGKLEGCITQEAAEWCQDILGCYCEEVGQVSGQLATSNRFLLHRVGQGQYLRGTREYVGLTAASLFGLHNYRQAAGPVVEQNPTDDTPPPLPPRPTPQTFEIPDPQEPEAAPIILEGPEPPEYEEEQLPDYDSMDPGAALLGTNPPGYRRRDHEAERGRSRSRLWNSFLAGAGFAGDRLFGGRVRNRFRGGGSGAIRLDKRNVNAEISEKA